MPDLLHVIPISKKKRNRHNTQLIEESVLPDLLHVIPMSKRKKEGKKEKNKPARHAAH
jgi:hypothetical protein